MEKKDAETGPIKQVLGGRLRVPYLVDSAVWITLATGEKIYFNEDVGPNTKALAEKYAGIEQRASALCQQLRLGGNCAALLAQIATNCSYHPGYGTSSIYDIKLILQFS